RTRRSARDPWRWRPIGVAVDSFLSDCDKNFGHPFGSLMAEKRPAAAKTVSKKSVRASLPPQQRTYDIPDHRLECFECVLSMDRDAATGETTYNVSGDLTAAAPP